MVWIKPIIAEAPYGPKFISRMQEWLAVQSCETLYTAALFNIPQVIVICQTHIGSANSFLDPFLGIHGAHKNLKALQSEGPNGNANTFSVLHLVLCQSHTT